MSKLLLAASDSVENRQVEQGRAAIAEARDLVLGMQRMIPGWGKDRDLNRDAGMLMAYMSALGSNSIVGGVGRTYLSYSLVFASLSKLLPKPVTE